MMHYYITTEPNRDLASIRIDARRMDIEVLSCVNEDQGSA